MSNRPGIKAAILKNRATGESRLAQAKRLAIPESTLRYCETRNVAPRNAHVRAFMLAALGISESVKGRP